MYGKLSGRKIELKSKNIVFLYTFIQIVSNFQSNNFWEKLLLLRDIAGFDDGMASPVWSVNNFSLMFQILHNPVQVAPVSTRVTFPDTRGIKRPPPALPVPAPPSKIAL